MWLIVEDEYGLKPSDDVPLECKRSKDLMKKFLQSLGTKRGSRMTGWPQKALGNVVGPKGTSVAHA